jgi:hypothetical protein
MKKKRNNMAEGMFEKYRLRIVTDEFCVVNLIALVNPTSFNFFNENSIEMLTEGGDELTL